MLSGREISVIHGYISLILKYDICFKSIMQLTIANKAAERDWTGNTIGSAYYF